MHHDGWPTHDRDATPPEPRTELLPVHGMEHTQRIPAVGGADDDTRPIPGAPSRPIEPTGAVESTGVPPRSRRPLLAGAAAFGVLLVLYLGDLLVNAGSIPRGVTVAGVAIGGLSSEDADRELRARLGQQARQPVTVREGNRSARLDPAAVGLAPDYPRTIERAGEQPWNPVTRITSFFTTTEIDPVSTSDRSRLTAAIDARRDALDAGAREGTIRFVPEAGGAVTAVAEEPRPGTRLDVGATADAVLRDWLTGPVTAVVDRQPVRTTEQGVRDTLREIVEPAVAAPVRLRGRGVTVTLNPTTIAGALSFVPDEGGRLAMRIDDRELAAAARPRLAGTERPGRNAKIVFDSGRPDVAPARFGRKVDWRATLTPLREVLGRSGAQRVLDVRYTRKQPAVTTKDAEALGITEVIGEFSTGGFATESGINIRQVAEEVDGAIVKPGKTFSLNEFTGPRTEAQGYVPAGIISDGVPSRAVGGGISQFATTLYNATYFAGLRDAGHQEHSYYISRYPAAREATVYLADDGEIDLAFTNDARTGVAIQTVWTPSDITVRLWGTKRYRVESITGDRTNVVQPGTERGKPGICEPSEGVAGFTITDTRVRYDADSGAEVDRNTRTVTYNPEPKIVCPRRPS